MNSVQKLYNWVSQNSLILIALFPLAKIRYIIGSQLPSYFSTAVIAMPVLGAYATGSTFATLFIIRFWMSFFFSNSSMITFFMTNYLPGLGAAVAMRYNHWLINLLVPAICMVLFIMHPVAGQVWFYALYWTIPALVALLATRFNHSYIARFAAALRSTFIAHALGSVVWAYYKPMTVAHWQLLLPLAAIERLIFATMIATACIVIDRVISLLAMVPARKQVVNKVFET